MLQRLVREAYRCVPLVSWQEKNKNVCVKVVFKKSPNYVVNFEANKYNAGRTQ